MNILASEGHMVSVTTTQLRFCSEKAAINNTYMSMCDYKTLFTKMGISIEVGPQAVVCCSRETIHELLLSLKFSQIIKNRLGNSYLCLFFSISASLSYN